MHFRTCIMVVCVVAFAGCNSIRTTFLEQDECGQLAKNPRHCRQGVPVMLKVPTHIEVKIIQTDYWKIEGEPGDSKKLIPLPQATSRKSSIQQVMTEKMFLLDPKRPASGIGQFSFAFASGKDTGKGVLTSAKYKAVDTTFKDSAKLLTTAIGAFTTGTKKSIGEDSTKLVSADRTIAYKRFPIDSNTEAEIECFVNQYLNGCTNDCTERPSYAPEKPNSSDLTK